MRLRGIFNSSFATAYIQQYIEPTADSSHEGPNPYHTNPEVMQPMLADPTINATEHAYYFPRLQVLLPGRGLPLAPNRVKRVLDFGCGPGNFTEDLARLYPAASILGADAEQAMVLAGSTSPNVAFREWNGLAPLKEDPFNLIVAKMVLHYISPDDLKTVMPNLAASLGESGSLVISVPHSADSRKHLNSEEPLRYAAHKIHREVGKTGVTASMWHRDHWIASTLRHMPPQYVAVEDEVRSMENESKRLHFLFYPRGKRVVAAYRKLGRLGLIRGNPRTFSAIAEEFSDELRAASDYFGI
jgi:2-polyprenyl-3-methyl-5-hydroxy-6-metoxy-1,4-benzoquinol methylase